jgi:hypothetical protein
VPATDAGAFGGAGSASNASRYTGRTTDTPWNSLLFINCPSCMIQSCPTALRMLSVVLTVSAIWISRHSLLVGICGCDQSPFISSACTVQHAGGVLRTGIPVAMAF